MPWAQVSPGRLEARLHSGIDEPTMIIQLIIEGTRRQKRPVGRFPASCCEAVGRPSRSLDLTTAPA
jgi:hypothetical protein